MSGAVTGSGPWAPGALELRATRAARHALWSSPVRTLGDAVAHQRRAHQRAVLLVRAFYALGLVWVVTEMRGWPRLLDTTEVDPQWPAGWMGSIDLTTAIGIVLYGFLACTVLVACLPRSRLARAAYALSLLQYLSFVNGFGKINGNLHTWLYVSLVLIFLPRIGWKGRTSVGERQRFLSTIWAAQVVVGMTYTLTGLWKVAYALADLRDPARTSSLEVDGFSVILAGRILETDQDPLIGDALVSLPVLGWMLFLGTMYLETSSILIPFRPRLHRVWGLGLVLFHFGTQLAMGFTFVQSVAVAGLLFICSPAAPDEVGVRAALGDLPGVLLLRRTWARVRARSSSTRPAASPAPARVRAGPRRTLRT